MPTESAFEAAETQQKKKTARRRTRSEDVAYLKLVYSSDWPSEPPPEEPQEGFAIVLALIGTFALAVILGIGCLF